MDSTTSSSSSSRQDGNNTKVKLLLSKLLLPTNSPHFSLTRSIDVTRGNGPRPNVSSAPSLNVTRNRYNHCISVHVCNES